MVYKFEFMVVCMKLKKSDILVQNGNKHVFGVWNSREGKNGIWKLNKTRPYSDLYMMTRTNGNRGKGSYTPSR